MLVTVIICATYYSLVSTTISLLDWKDATQPVSKMMPIVWLQLACPSQIPTLEKQVLINKEIQDYVLVSNAIYTRSNTGFNFQVEIMEYFETEYCTIDYGNSDHIDALREQALSFVNSKYEMPQNSTIVYAGNITYIRNGDTVKGPLRGFATVGHRHVHIRQDEIHGSSNILAHELGHSLSLLHPFNDKFLPILDLPRICTKEIDRVKQLSECPIELTTCGAEKEQLTNIMDYLPEKCSRRFYFSPRQVRTMRNFLRLDSP